MRLHIINNEKITIRTIQLFEKVFPQGNTFIVLETSRERFDISVFHSKIVFVNGNDAASFWRAVGDINQYKHVVIHCLGYRVTQLLKNISHPSIYWIEWGADLYINLLQPKGYKLFDNPDYMLRQKSILPLFITKLLYKARRKQYQIASRNFAKKVKYFVPDSMPGEYELLLSYYPELSHLQFKDFFYYPIDMILPDKNLTSKGRNIMINHCSSFTGNHFEVMDLLSTLDLAGRNIVIPVSYGDKKNAINIEKEATKLFGDRALIIKDYLPLEEYNKVLEDCDVFIFGHYRQEAVGNILIALYLGGKVFLHNYNPLLGFYKSIGLTLYSIEDDLDSSSLKQKMTLQEINKNKQILEEYYSEERLLRLIKENFD